MSKQALTQSTTAKKNTRTKGPKVIYFIKKIQKVDCTSRQKKTVKRENNNNIEQQSEQRTN